MSRKKQAPRKPAAAHISRLKLSKELTSVLSQAGIQDIYDIASKTKGEILSLWGMNFSKLKELETKLEGYFANRRLNEQHLRFFNVRSVTQSENQRRDTNRSAQDEGFNSANQLNLTYPIEAPTTLDTQTLFPETQEENIKLHQGIEILGLSRRAYNALQRSRLRTVQDIISYNNGNLEDIRYLGRKTLEEIQTRLEQYLGRSIQLLPRVNPLVHTNLKVIKIKQHRTENKPRRMLEHNATYRVKFATLDQELQFLISSLKPREFRVIIARFGFKPFTLQEIADEFRVSRERIRQLERRAIARIAKCLEINHFKRLETALLYAQELGPHFSIKDWESLLLGKEVANESLLTVHGLTDKPRRIVEIIVAFLQAYADSSSPLKKYELPEFVYTVIDNPSFSYEQIAISKRLSKIDLRKIRRECRNSGAISAAIVGRRLKVSTEMAALALQTHGYVSITPEWLVKDPPMVKDTNARIFPFRTNVIKMLNVCGPLSVDSIREGLDNHISRFRMSAPPVSVLCKVLERYGFNVDTNNIVTDYPKTKISLNEGERIFFNIVNADGPVVNFNELSHEFEKNKLSSALLSVTLRYSAIVQRIDQGLYTLRGTRLSRQDVEAANARRPEIEQDSTFHYSSDGIITYEINVGVFGKTGTFPVGEAKRLSGEWQVVDNNIHLGNAQVGETQIWGLGKAMKHHRVQLGDRIALRFNPETRTIHIAKMRRDGD